MITKPPPAKLPNIEIPIQSARQKILLMAFRQAIIIALGAIEDYLEMERSITPRHKRDRR